MRSFSEYVQVKNINILMSEVAHKMVEVNVDPWDFLIEYYKDNTELVVALENHKEETLNEFLGTLGSIGRGIASAAKGALGYGQKAAGVIGQGAKDFGGGVRDAFVGPETRYTSALEALKGLSNELNKNQMVQKAASEDDVTRKLIGDLKGIMKQLEQQKQHVTNQLRRQMGQVDTTYTDPRYGQKPQTQTQQAQQPQPQQPQPQQPQPQQPQAQAQQRQPDLQTRQKASTSESTLN